LAEQMPPLPKPPGAESGPAQKPSLLKAAKAIKDVRVIALGVGFYKQLRKKAGDAFVVDTLADVGSWMKCEDPVLEKKHQELMRERKRVARAQASQFNTDDVSGEY